MRCGGRRGALWQVVAVAVVVLGAMSGEVTAGAQEGAGEAFSGQPVAVAGSWTVLQYSMSDTDLEPFMMVDVNEMGEVGSNENLNIVAMIDRSPEYGEEPVLDIGDWVGAKLVHVQPGHAEVLADLGPTDMGDPATLAWFITEGIAAFPAEHYAVIISDHGAAWPGVGPDDSAESLLEPVEIQSALATGLADAGVERLDLLGFDACLMAAYEVASALAPYADRLVASSELEPGSGWDYRSLQLLADYPAATVDELGTAIVDSFIAGNDPDTTLALLDLTQMPLLDEAMAAFTSVLIERSATVAPDVGRTLAVNPGYGRSPDPTQDHHMTDLGALTATIGIEALDVSDQADAVLRALNDVVVHKGSGALAASFSGLSIYFPPSADLFNPYYVDFVPNTSGWADFLDAYYAAGQGIAATDLPAFVNVEPDVTGDATGLTVEWHAGHGLGRELVERHDQLRHPVRRRLNDLLRRRASDDRQRRIRARQRLLRPDRPAHLRRRRHRYGLHLAQHRRRDRCRVRARGSDGLLPARMGGRRPLRGRRVEHHRRR